LSALKITGIPGFDGEYPLDVSYFTNRELHTIKELSKVRAGELSEALQAGDNDVLVALAVIAVQRAGKPVPKDASPFWDAPSGSSLEFVLDEENDASPPASAPENGPDLKNYDDGTP
jgi:hypothetical protein